MKLVYRQETYKKVATGGEAGRSETDRWPVRHTDRRRVGSEQTNNEGREDKETHGYKEGPTDSVPQRNIMFAAASEPTITGPVLGILTTKNGTATRGRSKGQRQTTQSGLCSPMNKRRMASRLRSKYILSCWCCS